MAVSDMYNFEIEDATFLLAFLVEAVKKLKPQHMGMAEFLGRLADGRDSHVVSAVYSVWGFASGIIHVAATITLQVSADEGSSFVGCTQG
jgi:hypothetical protein